MAAIPGMSLFTHLVNIILRPIGFKEGEREVTKTTQAIDQSLGTVQKAGRPAISVVDQYQKALMRVAIVVPVWMAARAAIQAFFGLISSQMKFLQDMENAMARIQIVGKGTAEEYDNLKKSLIGLAVAYGTSATEALEAAKIFAQQGKTVSETLTLTRIAMVGAQVLGKDIKTVVEDLTATMKAFNIPAENVASIIDKLINVERQFAVTSKELAEGIKRTGATANQMGVSLAALIGDITAVVEVTRKSGQEAARGLQFIYARLLTTAKPVIEQLTKINFYLDEQGKETSALTGRLRSATDILDDLARKWGTLTNEERLNIAVATGSKRQLVVLNALMQNYTHSIDARIAALTSAGQAEKALAIIQDTVTYKTQQLSSAWNALTSAVANTSAWKAVLDIQTKLIESFLKLMNVEEGYRLEAARRNAKTMAELETRQNEVDSIKELVRVRKKLLAEPPTDKTTERIEKINEMINKIAGENPQLQLVLKEGTEEELSKEVKKITDTISAKKIIEQVTLEYEPKIRKLEVKREELAITPETAVIYSKEIANIDKEIIKLRKQMTAEASKQYAIIQAQNLGQQIEDEEEILELRGELTEAEKEQLKIEKEMIRFTLITNSTLEQQIEKRIDLVKNSKYMYDAHKKNLELEKLQNDLIDARLKKKEEERNKLASLAMQYEKANDLEQERIRRVTELMRLSPEELARRFEEDFFDKEIIQDFWSFFDDKAKRAIEESAIRLSGLEIGDTLMQQFEELEETVKRLKETDWTVRYGKGGITAPGTPITGFAGISPIINQQTLVEIGNISGAIDRESLARILSEIEQKLKASPSYIDENVAEEIINLIEKDISKQERLGKALFPGGLK